MSILARFTLALLANALCEWIRPTIYREVFAGLVKIAGWSSELGHVETCRFELYQTEKRRPWEAS